MKINEQKAQKSIEETLSFKEAYKIKSKALVKNG